MSEVEFLTMASFFGLFVVVPMVGFPVIKVGTLNILLSFSSHTVPIEFCQSDFPRFTEIKECKYWQSKMGLFGPVPDLPFYSKIYGKSSDCEGFLKLPKGHKETAVAEYPDYCTGLDHKEWSEVKCSDYSVPENYRCFACTPFTDQMFAFKPDCEDSIAYKVRGLDLKEVGIEPKLKIQK